MSVDPSCYEGRRIQWKFIIILLVLAAAAAVLSFLEVEHIIPYISARPRVFWSSEAAPSREDNAFSTNLSLQEGTLKLPGRLLFYTQGDGLTAVTVSQSGAKTVTYLYDEELRELGSVFLRDSTAVAMAISEDGVLLLQLSRGGGWSLARYRITGELCEAYSLDVTAGLGILWAGDTPVVWSDRGLHFFPGEEVFLPVPGILAVEGLPNGNLSAITAQTLYTASSRGELLGQKQLSYIPRQLAVGNRYVYVLFGEGVGCYDLRAKLVWFSEEGAKAKSMDATAFGCVLYPYESEYSDLS